MLGSMKPRSARAAQLAFRRAASPAVAGKRSMASVHVNPIVRTSQDEMWYRLHNMWPVQVPLTHQMPGTPRGEEGVAAAEPVMKVTTLSNGVRIITETRASVGCSMAIFLHTGSRFETEETHGSTHFLQHLAYKSTEEKSHFMVTRAIERLGGHVAAGASRDCITFAGECLASNSSGVFALMAETALKPRLDKWDMDQARMLVQSDISNSAKNGAMAVHDVLHTVAFQGQTVGAPLMCNPAVADYIMGETVSQFLAETVDPTRIIVAAVGVDHAKMVADAEAAFGEMAKSNLAPAEAAEYTGGDLRMPGEQGQVHLAIGFKGVACDDKDLLAAATLQSLLGGGDQFSAGGPGKGLTSRIFTKVLHHPEVLTANSFNVSYGDAGLFGIQATANAQDAQKTVRLMMQELSALRNGSISDEEVVRAKNMTRSSLHLNLETAGIVCEDLGRQILYYGERKSGAAISAEIAALTKDDLTKAAEKMLSSPVSVAAYGDVAWVPAYADICAGLN
mmetsp:Transcript_24481/g.55861  ORF Transcript_24481/g.55861 Transcript_24481/m.55861 type:complete len:507 (-) Transcript_24481:184-1704(-)